AVAGTADIDEALDFRLGNGAIPAIAGNRAIQAAVCSLTIAIAVRNLAPAAAASADVILRHQAGKVNGYAVNQDCAAALKGTADSSGKVAGDLAQIEAALVGV
ncbi:MAG: hypothetical protein AAB281_04030, partial [Actinomycetota bacterium]